MGEFLRSSIPVEGKCLLLTPEGQRSLRACLSDALSYIGFTMQPSTCGGTLLALHQQSGKRSRMRLAYSRRQHHLSRPAAVALPDSRGLMI